MLDIERRDKVAVDTFTSPWYDPYAIKDKLLSLFPNSKVEFIPQYPTSGDNFRILTDSLDMETVFVSLFPISAYVGTERFTSRMISLLNAMQVTGRVSTVVHFGNPYLMEDLPHIPRIIIGTTSPKGIEYALDVLAGDLEARGVLCYDVSFTKKGDSIHERIGKK
jgi:hypothetical protein